MLRNRTLPPAFALPDDAGQLQTLDALREGKLLVLLFFRGAFCATARRDLLAYADVYERMGWLNTGLVAVSVDDPTTLRQLRTQLELPFPLLSDADFAVSTQYGIYASDETDRGPQPHGEPGTFVLDADGHLVFSQVQSGPKGAASPGEVLLILVYMFHNEGRYW